MNTESIYTKRQNAQHDIQCLASELSTCDRLLVMGYTHAGSVRLVDRADYLSKEVARLEEMKKRSLR